MAEGVTVSDAPLTSSQLESVAKACDMTGVPLDSASMKAVCGRGAMTMDKYMLPILFSHSLTHVLLSKFRWKVIVETAKKDPRFADMSVNHF